jgi:hypothetical protein
MAGVVAEEEPADPVAALEEHRALTRARLYLKLRHSIAALSTFSTQQILLSDYLAGSNLS